MLAGEPPVTGPTAQAMIAKLMTERPTPLRVVRDTVPVAVDAAVARALAKTPADRFATAGELTRALAEQSDPVPRPTTRLRRTAIAAVALACAVVAGAYAWGRARPGAPSGAAPIRLAVLPFESIGDSSDPTFGDGMSEAILERLARVPRLSLMGRASVLRYRASGRTAIEFAHSLGVEYVLDGTVRWAVARGGGRQVRISPELIKVDDGTRVWGEPYEGLLANVFELQGDVAERVATALRGTLGAGEKVLVRGAPTGDVEAYRAYLLGRQVLGTRWWAGGEAAKRFEEAIARDSNFARAYAGLAVAYSLAWDFGERSLPRDTVYARARGAARRALTLDSTLSEAHTALGRLLDAADWNWRAAGIEFHRALALDPTDAAARRVVRHAPARDRPDRGGGDRGPHGVAVRSPDAAHGQCPGARALVRRPGGQRHEGIHRLAGVGLDGQRGRQSDGACMAEGRAREAEDLTRRWPAAGDPRGRAAHRPGPCRPPGEGRSAAEAEGRVR